MRWPKLHLPKFSIVDLLWIMLATAAGLGVGRVYESDFDQPLNWSRALQVSGAMLLVVALIRHAVSLVSVSKNPSKGIGFARWIRIGTAVTLAMSILGLVTLSVLFQRKILARPKREDLLQLFNDLVPDLLMTLAAIASIHFFLLPRSSRKTSFGSMAINSIVILCVAALTAWVLFHRTELTMLVHAAICQLEAMHPIWLQRTDAFPHHGLEGYRSFWLSVAASCGVLMSVVLFTISGKARTPNTQRCLKIGCGAIWLMLTSFVIWFSMSEFPRINPDLASAPSARHWIDSVAAIVIVLSLSWWLAVRSARTCSSTTQSDCEITGGGVLAVLGALMLGLGELTVMLIPLIEFMDVSPFVFSDWILVFEDIADWPEIFLPMLPLVFALSLTWQTLRRGDEPHQLSPLSPKLVCFNFVAWFALIVTGISVLKAFAICSWLGPFVL